MKPRLTTQQKITAFANKYKIMHASESGSAGEVVAFAQQKRIAFKEKVTFYNDESKSLAIFTFRAEKVFDVHGRYIVEDASGVVIGMFKKEFRKSLFISTWRVLDASGNELFTVKENNVAIAVLRRFVGFVPFVGDFLELLIKFFKYHFSYIDVRTNQEVGQYKKTTLFRDHYLLSMTDDAYDKCDWRVLAAMGVGLDALQSR